MARLWITIGAAATLSACIAMPNDFPPEGAPLATRDGGAGRDAGAPEDGSSDAGAPQNQTSPKDGGAPTALDAGTDRRDAGVPIADAGAPPPRDAGIAPPPDAGTATPRDAGAPPRDAGPPPGACAYVPKDESAYTCVGPEVTSLYNARILAAIDTLYREQPGLFDFTDNPYGCCPRVRDPDGYVQGVAEILNRAGDVCAMQDPNAGDELAIKDRRGEESEGFDILTADGYVRRGPGIFRGTCRPAWF